MKRRRKRLEAEELPKHIEMRVKLGPGRVLTADQKCIVSVRVDRRVRLKPISIQKTGHPESERNMYQ